MDLVSIIVTTKNEEKNIGRLLTSIVGQSYGDIEIIVVDNNSIDRTRKIARKFTDNVFTLGPERSIQRNYGAKRSKGKYLLFLDADMELSKNVVSACVKKIKSGIFKALVIAEKTTGEGLVAKLRKFERSMYEGDPSIEVARFFDKNVFDEFSGYDPRLTGPEDYDLPYRISKVYKIGRVDNYIYHHEESLSLFKLLKKRFYYGNRGAHYAQKHPELILRQGILIFRKAYLRHWHKFIRQPFLGMAFLFVRFLETLAAGLGFLSALITK